MRNAAKQIGRDNKTIHVKTKRQKSNRERIMCSYIITQSSARCDKTEPEREILIYVRFYSLSFALASGIFRQMLGMNENKRSNKVNNN